jgi:glycosyltransferase involved in cell wall biosynthesis
MKVLMLPTLHSQKKHESGIRRVIEAYHRYGPEFGIQFVESGNNFDLRVVHAGTTTEQADVAMLHGMYWTADYNASDAEYRTNARIVHSLRTAKEVTVPSAWVAETFQRDMRFTPHIIPHGIEWREWLHEERCGDYVLWNKNRHAVDVCDATAVGVLAERFPSQRFLSTFAPDNVPTNVRTTGLVPHAEMKTMVQQAAVYLSTVKETFCIGNLEAMASGVPVLGWANGGNLDLVEHGTNGYLARPGDYDDLAEGLNYCLKHRKVLGANGREMARRWTWQAAMEKLVKVLEAAMVEEPPTVGVVIPVYNKSEQELRRAVESVISQTYDQLAEIIVVDDGSTDTGRYDELIKDIQRKDKRIRLIEKPNSGVAHSRNEGISNTRSKYICCLDADDWLEPDFLRVCVEALERDRSLGIAYTGMRTHQPDGSQKIGHWPGQADADRHAERNPQVPTCNVFRRKVWQRLGGYRQRYAPDGAGAEDAELWLRMMAYGWRAEEVTSEPLFNYSWLSGLVSGNPDYREVDWTAWHPWTRDRQYPFAAVMRPGHISHKVRQYDEPLISVIIPVGPGHEGLVVDALDSLEAQVFRKWEAIVVWDGQEYEEMEDGRFMLTSDQIATIQVAYPYAHFHWTGEGPKGAGFARNRGAELARAPLLLFLDADDWLKSQAMSGMLDAWKKTESIVYSDYVKHIHDVPRDKAAELHRDRRLVSYNESRHEAVVKFNAYEFDCERASRQPEAPVPYYWCLTTCLVPRAWHDEIGGFDETMESWEDADYAFRMVRAGHCYARVPDELVMVRTYTGQRLNRGLQIGPNLVKYMQNKYAGSEVIDDVCKGCGSKRVATSRSMAARPGTNRRQIVELPDSDMVKVQYNTRNKGKHHVYGTTVNPLTGKKFFYGHRGAGDEFPVHRGDVYYVNERTGRVTVSNVFVPIEEQHAEVRVPEPKRKKIAPPMSVSKRGFEGIQTQINSGPVDVLTSVSMDDEAAPVVPPGGKLFEPPAEAKIPDNREGYTETIINTRNGDIDSDELDAAIIDMIRQEPSSVDISMGTPSESAIREGIQDRKELEYVPKPFNFQKLPGVTPAIAKQFEARGLTTADEVADLGVDGLQELKGIGPTRARAIIEYLDR